MNTIKKILDVLFVSGVAGFVLLGSLFVIIQLIAVITLNGALATGAVNQLSLPAIVIASITGLIAFIQSYLYGWKIE